MKKNVQIIGAGIAGLSAASYLVMNGFEVTVLERRSAVGGLCASWQHDDYHLDLCSHWLSTFGSASVLYRGWNELPPFQALPVSYPDEYLCVENVAGEQIHFFTDVAKLEAELLQKAPEDQERILELANAIRKLQHVELPHTHAPELYSLWQHVKNMGELLPFFGIFNHFGNQTLAEYASTFENPLLQKAIFHAHHPEQPAIVLPLYLALGNKQALGSPAGPSAQLAHQLADFFTGMGGTIRYQCEVTHIRTEDNRAIGVEIADGAFLPSDYVLSAADGYSTLFELLDGKYLNDRLKSLYTEGQAYPSLLLFLLGVRQNLEDWPANLVFPMKKSLVIDPQTIIDELQVRVFTDTNGMAPNGKSLLSIGIETRFFEYWKQLATENPAKLETEKERILRRITAELEMRFGQIAANIDMVDITTPSAIFKFTHHWKGSTLGWMASGDTLLHPLPLQVPTLRNGYLCGQWIAVGGGLPAVVLSGRDAAELICAAENRPFTTSTPKPSKEPD